VYTISGGSWIFIAPPGTSGVTGGYGCTAGATVTTTGDYSVVGPDSSNTYTLTIPLRREVMNSNLSNPGPWTGSGTYDVYFRVGNASSKSVSPVVFSSGATTVSYYQFQPVSSW
jgi:hypothetical protein